MQKSKQTLGETHNTEETNFETAKLPSSRRLPSNKLNLSKVKSPIYSMSSDKKRSISSNFNRPKSSVSATTNYQKERKYFRDNSSSLLAISKPLSNKTSYIENSKNIFVYYLSKTT